MKFGIAFAFQNYTDWDRFYALERGEEVGPPAEPDYKIWQEGVALADMVEPLGFDSLWTMEQHAAPYLMICDPTQFLTYMAGRTKHIDFGSMITVLPWHNPIRLAEQITMLQYVLGPERKYFLGVGRGLARRNFNAMGVDMDTSRERFNEVYDILELAFTQEIFSYHGQFFDYDNVSIRPRPFDPTVVTEAYAAWTTETSMRKFAERGLNPLTTLNKSMDIWLEELDTYLPNSRGVRSRHGAAPGLRGADLCVRVRGRGARGRGAVLPRVHRLGGQDLRGGLVGVRHGQGL